MKEKVLLNAIIGDICGSIYEWKRIKHKPDSLINNKCKFTDDTVHTIAIAEALITDCDFAEHLRSWSRRYPTAGYGGMMRRWIWNGNAGPYNSYGNGSAMRVSACGWMNDFEKLAIESAMVTHNHPEGIKGAEIIAKCIYQVRKAMEINQSISPTPLIVGYLGLYYPDYDPRITLDQRRSNYRFDSTCQGSVPQSIQCVLEAKDYEDALKLAISMGGDADTMACIAGSVAGVIWEKPDELVEFALSKLPDEMIRVIEDFDEYINVK